jgi:hypothetical protein
VQRALGALHYELGMARMAGDDNLPSAATHLRAALQTDPSNTDAQGALDKVVTRAKEIYLRGYAAKDGDPETAKAAFRQVIQILPAEDETGQKARVWLQKLDKPR